LPSDLAVRPKVAAKRLGHTRAVRRMAKPPLPQAKLSALRNLRH
jgi:hypothetical protein